MSDPVRSEAVARALAEEADGLPPDFAASVAALARARAARQSRGTDLALLGAFIAMLGVCVVGWFELGAPDFAWRDVAPSWLVIGLAGVALVQLLTFRRRLAT